MTKAKRVLRGAPDIGAAIDERIRQQSAKLELRDSTGQAPLAPLAGAGGGSIGGGGDSGDLPAFPETVVVSVSVESGSARSGRLDLAGAGTLSISAESEGSPPPDHRITFTASSVLSVEELPAAGDPEVIYRLSPAGELWWDPSGGGDWQQLNIESAAYWQRDGTVLSPADSGDSLSVISSNSPASIYVSNDNSHAYGILVENDMMDGAAGIAISSFGPSIVAVSSDADCISCSTNNSGNDKYGGVFDRINVDRLDIAESGSGPATPPAGRVRIYALEDSKLYAKDDSGTVALLNTIEDHAALSGLDADDHSQYLLLQPASAARNLLQAAADCTGLTIRAGTGQSSALTEWQNEHATVIAQLDSGGIFSAAGISAASSLASSGSLSLGVTAFSASNGANHDILVSAASILRISGPTAAFSITGIDGGSAGRLLYIDNTTVQNLTLAHEHAGSSAANRIHSSSGADISTTGEGSFLLYYDSVSSRWRILNREA